MFDTAEKAAAVAEYAGVGGGLPINSGRHLYFNWTPIMEKRGAFNPLMDPFKMEANKDIIPDYSKDMCAHSLDILSKIVYIYINPDWTKEEMDAKIKSITEATRA